MQPDRSRVKTARLRFDRFDSIRDFASRLKDHRDASVRGAWNPAQILFHLAAAIELSCQPRPADLRRTSRLLKWSLRWVVLKRGVPRNRPMAPELKQALSPPPNAVLDEQLERLLESMEAFERITHEHPPHPVLGDLTHDEWRTFHLRHCELHLGMIDLNRAQPRRA